jgi:hypothetical protein
MSPIVLNHDPYAVFRSSRTPCGLYARQKWLEEALTEGWQKDSYATVAELYNGLDRGGLLPDWPIHTIRHLFGLHLTVREADTRIDTVLERLIDSIVDQSPPTYGPHVGPDRLRGLPFIAGRWIDVIFPATLFLSVIFGRAGDARVRACYRRLSSELIAAQKDDLDAARLSNAMRALAVLPDCAEQPSVRLAVSLVAGRQTTIGDWGADMPFFQTLNALAHLDMPEAHAQCERAIRRVVSIQNDDGTWGSRQRQWHTFLVVHALRNKGVL